ncbi:hypothetical protein [Amycolatopsis sp. NPDC051903]|uniref:hypothetical protein n=1 Tax=Amycolatopsis sp. NPDC051903 TaxID=3363936 RepID=UPI0037941649
MINLFPSGRKNVPTDSADVKNQPEALSSDRIPAEGRIDMILNALLQYDTAGTDAAHQGRCAHRHMGDHEIEH